MRIPLTVGIVLVLVCSGCGSMKQNFQENFDKSFRESCRTGVMKHGATQKVAEKYCDCTLAKFKETKSMDESAKTCLAQLKSDTHPWARFVAAAMGPLAVSGVTWRILDWSTIADALSLTLVVSVQQLDSGQVTGNTEVKLSPGSDE